MTETSLKPFEQEAWSARAATWLDGPARATAPGATQLLEALEIGPQDAVLDLCCGPGVLAGAAYALGAEPVGIDFAPAMIAKARERLPAVQFFIGDAEALNVRESEFDAVACNFALAQLANPEHAMREALRALKPGGRFAWTAWVADRDDALAAAAEKAIEAYGDAAIRADSAARGIARLGKPGVASAAMRRAGFRDVRADLAPIRFEAPRARAAAAARAMAPRVPIQLDRQPPEAIRAIDADIERRIKALAEPVDGADAAETVALTASCLLVIGVKPMSPTARAPKFGIVKRILGGEAATPAASRRGG